VFASLLPEPAQVVEGYRREMDPGEILILTGPPAAGKTTVAELIVGQWDLSVHLQADYFWDEFIRSGFLRPWMPESHEQNTTVINAITAAAVEYAKGGYSVLVDGIVGPWFVELVAETFADHEARWHYAILLPASDVNVERSRSRSKAITQEVLEKMHSEFTAHLAGYEKYVVDSTHLDATQTAEAVNKKMEIGELRIG
jgi:adenylate kinase family enzyme